MSNNYDIKLALIWNYVLIKLIIIYKHVLNPSNSCCHHKLNEMLKNLLTLDQQYKVYTMYSWHSVHHFKISSFHL